MCLVTDRSLCGGRPLEWVVERALRGGVTMVQIREKEETTREFTGLAKRMVELTRGFGVPLIVNDRLDVAMAVGADGVHLGQSDLPVELARKVGGERLVIGWSVESLEDARRAEDLDLDYLGISPVYGTTTKTDTAPALGLEGVSAIAGMSRHWSLAIGGMNAETGRGVIRQGATGLAVVSAICSAEDPEEAARRLRGVIEEGLGEVMHET